MKAFVSDCTIASFSCYLYQFTYHTNAGRTPLVTPSQCHIECGHDVELMNLGTSQGYSRPASERGSQNQRAGTVKTLWRCFYAFRRVLRKLLKQAEFDAN